MKKFTYRQVRRKIEPASSKKEENKEQQFFVFKRDVGVSHGRSEPFHQCSQSRSLRTVGQTEFQTLAVSFFCIRCVRHFDKSSLILT